MGHFLFAFGIGACGPLPVVLGGATGFMTEKPASALAATQLFFLIQTIVLGQVTQMVTMERKVLAGLLYGAPIVNLLALVMKIVTA